MNAICDMKYLRKMKNIFNFQFHCVLFGFYFCAIVAQCELFTSQSDLESLIYIRREVKVSLDRYLRKEEERLAYLKQRLEASRGFSTNKKENDNTGNPINAFLLVKALTLDLSELITVAGDRQNFREFADTVEALNSEVTFPNGEDINGVALGLIRLQDTYELETKAIANGVIGDSCCAPQLSVEDCFELGRQSYHAKEYGYAIEWFTEALSRMSSTSPLLDNENSSSNILKNSSDLQINSTTSKSSSEPRRQGLSPAGKVSKSDILDYLHWAQNIQKTVQVGKEFLSSMTGIELDAFVEEVAQVMAGQKEKQAQKMLALQYKTLCKRTNSSVSRQNPKYKCEYSTKENDPYFILGPVKQELVNLIPPIWSFKDVISDQEIEAIKLLSKPKFETAMIVNVMTGSNERSDTRISKSAWLDDTDGSVVRKVNERIGRITGLSINSAELLQVANYGIGGMYLPHYDFAQPGQAANFMINDGNRIATMLIYMSDVEKGGATVFPKLNLTVFPEKGSAVFWYNLMKNGEGDLRTQHAACPVIGSKWVSNKWLHERGQEFRYKCGLKIDE